MRPWVASLVSLVGGIALGVVLLVTMLIVPAAAASLTAPPCPTSSVTPINGTTYWCRTISLEWNATTGNSSNVTFRAVLFQFHVSITYDCGATALVTGHELVETSEQTQVGAGQPISLFPPCSARGVQEFPSPTRFSPDQIFGATWVAYSSMQLYVRATDVGGTPQVL